MARLVVLTEGLAGASHELKVERTTIGRVDDNAFPIPEASISGHHCEVLLRGTEVVVRDLNSTNGTFINGEATKEGVLKPGQILRLGQIELRLEDGTSKPLPPPPKKPLSTTSVIPSGVKLNELEHTDRRVDSPFAKKSNKVNKIFFYGGLLFGAVIIGVIVYAIFMTGNIK